MKVEIQSQKGLRIVLSVVVDKKFIQEKIKERLSQLQKKLRLKDLDQAKFLHLLSKVSLENLFMVKYR